jgi:hypothetical protein
MESWQLDRLSSVTLADWFGGRGIVDSHVVSITTWIWAERASLKAVRGKKGCCSKAGCCWAISSTCGAVGGLTAPGGGGGGGVQLWHD